MLTFQVDRRIVYQALYYTYRCMRRVHQFPELQLSSPVGRNCHGREKKVPSGKSEQKIMRDENLLGSKVKKRTIDANMQP